MSSSENSFTNRVEDWEMPRTPVTCRCGIVAPMWVAWKEGTADPGRRFIGCARFKDNKLCCRFFKWCDPPFTERSREVILQLKGKIERSNEKIESLMEVIKKMETENILMSKGEINNEEKEVLVLQRQGQQLRKKIDKQSSMEKKLWIALVVSWILFFIVLQPNV